MHCGRTVDQLPGSGKVIDIFKLFLSDEFLNKIARRTNRWFEVKKAAKPLKHKTPFLPITDVMELKAYFALLLATNRDVILPRYENYFRQDERKWLFLLRGFNCVQSLSIGALSSMNYDSETAYLRRFEVYLGKGREEQEVSDIEKSGAVVARLTQDFWGKCHSLYIDTWYTSVALCMYLQDAACLSVELFDQIEKDIPKN